MKTRRRSVVLSDYHVSQATSEPPAVGSNPDTEINQIQADGQPEGNSTQVTDNLESAPDVPSEMAQEVWESLREEFYEREPSFLEYVLGM
jgi:hypothetical protein